MNDKTPSSDARSYEVSANDFIEAQTKRIEREFHCSRPKPRNRAMGFPEPAKNRDRKAGLNGGGE